MSTFVDFQYVSQYHISGGSVLKIAYLSKEDWQDVRNIVINLIQKCSNTCCFERVCNIYACTHVQVRGSKKLSFHDIC